MPACWCLPAEGAGAPGPLSPEPRRRLLAVGRSARGDVAPAGRATWTCTARARWAGQPGERRRPWAACGRGLVGGKWEGRECLAPWPRVPEAGRMLRPLPWVAGERRHLVHVGAELPGGDEVRQAAGKVHPGSIRSGQLCLWREAAGGERGWPAGAGAGRAEGRQRGARASRVRRSRPSW